MNVLLKKFILPLLGMMVVFGGLFVFRDGWSELTYGGADPWSVLFIALGGVAPAAVIALLAAVVVKVIKRDTAFLNTWLVVFLIASVVFAVSLLKAGTYAAAAAQETTSQEIINIMKVSHLASCQEALKQQSDDLGLEMTQDQITDHCRCVGDAYFDSFTSDDFDETSNTGKLPVRILETQEEIQIACFAKVVSE